MNDKADLLRAEALDLISRAKSMIVLLHAEERRGEAWTLSVETAVEHLSEAHKQVEVLNINNPEAGRNSLLTRTETSRGASVAPRLARLLAE